MGLSGDFDRCLKGLFDLSPCSGGSLDDDLALLRGDRGGVASVMFDDDIAVLSTTLSFPFSFFLLAISVVVLAPSAIPTFCPSAPPLFSFGAGVDSRPALSRSVYSPFFSFCASRGDRLGSTTAFEEVATSASFSATAVPLSGWDEGSRSVLDGDPSGGGFGLLPNPG